MASSTENLAALSSILSSTINTYLERLSAIDAPHPTLKPAPPVFLKDEAVLLAKAEIIRACEKIMTLVQAPFESLLVLSLAWHETGVLRLAYDMELAEHIPLTGDVSLDELAEKTGGSKDLILRVLRALTNRSCFVETSPLHYAHTAISANLTVPALNAFIGHTLEEAYNSGAHLSDVIKENNFNNPDDASKTAFNKAFKTDKPYFDYIYSHPDPSRAERFSLGQKGVALASHLPQNTYTPLQTLPSGTIVCDVGGGLGQVSIDMAKTCPGPKFIVQDQEIVMNQARKEYSSEELGDRIEYRALDFFKEQPVKNADVYYMRHILHDHPDSNCRRILSNVVAAMEPGKSTLLIDELILPERIGPDQNRFSHFRDLQMLILCNSSERTENQWRALLKSADERLVVKKIWGLSDNPGLSSSPILECRLQV